MIASCQKRLPLCIPEIDAQVIDLPIEQPGQIRISEKEYLGLKCEVGYWKAMHKKAIAREKILKRIIKELEGKNRDLRHRVFGKKSEKKLPVKMKANQRIRLPNVLVVSNPAVRDMDVQNVPIFPKKKKMLDYLKFLYALIATNHIYQMKTRTLKLLKLKSMRIPVKLNASV